MSIYIEAVYLGMVLLGTPVLMFMFWRGSFRDVLAVSPRQYETVVSWAEAWLGGSLGGTVLAIKWHYHATARGIWNADRRAWRFLTPHLSGALAFAIIALITSGIVTALDEVRLREPAASVALGFVVGLFADNATARLAVVADNVFGTVGQNREEEKGVLESGADETKASG